MKANSYGLYPEILSRYPRSIARIERAFDDPKRVLYAVLPECEAARAFDWEAAGKRRSADRDAKKNADRAGAAAHTLTAFLRNNRPQASPTLATILNKHGIRLEDETDPMSAVEAALADLGKALVSDPPLLLAKRGPMLHRNQYGPLLFPEPIEDRASNQLPVPHSAHALYMVFLLRKITHLGSARAMDGEPMPKGGKPHYAIAAALADETFDTKAESDPDAMREKLKAILRRTPNIEFISYD